MSSAQLEKFAQIKPADIEWRDGLPFSREFDDIYFSPQDGLAESEYVFLEGNSLPEDWYQKEQDRFLIGELGFGSGLNFFITAEKWRTFLNSKPENQNKHLHFISIEKRPMTVNDFKRSSEHWSQFDDLSKQLVHQYPSLTFGRHQIEFTELNLTLTLFFMPVEQALNDLLYESLAQENKTQIDYWYLDGFAPVKNTSMWANNVIKNISLLSKPGTKLATFSVSAAVKTPLKQNGFVLEKRKGFGRKREMLTARLPSKPENYIRRGFINLKYDKPWFDVSRSQPNDKVAIIGGGIAGCSLAYSLTRKGINVDLFEEKDVIAKGASGAAAGIFHPQLTGDFNLGSQVHWQAFLYLLNFIAKLSDAEKDAIVISRGIQRIVNSSEQKAQLLDLVQELNIHDQINDFESALPSFFYGNAYALDIPKLCQLFIDKCEGTLVSLHLNKRVVEISKSKNDTFSICIENVKTNQKENKNYSDIVYCAGKNEPLFENFSIDSVHWTRGQTCLVKSTQLAEQVDHVICEKLYLVPQKGAQFIVGSTFDDFHNNELSLESQQSLVYRLHELLTQLKLIDKSSAADLDSLLLKESLNGQVGYRLHTSDRLPLVGPSPDIAKLNDSFNKLGQKRIKWDEVSTYNRPGLWVNTGFGSHGLLMSLLSAQHLTSLITNQLSPLSNELSNRLHPARFMVGKLKR